jgi:hypothetical protein
LGEEEYLNSITPPTRDKPIAELPQFVRLTPATLFEELYDKRHAVARSVLGRNPAECYRLVAESDLPPMESDARRFIEYLAITISEARRFCRRHDVPIPEHLKEPQVPWPEAASIDAITVAELPHMPVAEVARRWAQELGEHGTGENMIRRTIWRAFWRGDLAREKGLLLLLRTKGSYLGPRLEHFPRAKLLLAFLTVAPDPLLVPLERTPQMNEDGQVTDATDGDYGAVADHWDEIVRRMESEGWREVYIDPAMVERRSFLTWCEEVGRAPPGFWNGIDADRVPESSEASEAVEANETPDSQIRPRGRPAGSGSFAASDEPLIAEMRSLIETERTLSPWAAAARVADRAAGGGTHESKIKRLVSRYSEKFSETQR